MSEAVRSIHRPCTYALASVHIVRLVASPFLYASHACPANSSGDMYLIFPGLLYRCAMGLHMNDCRIDWPGCSGLLKGMVEMGEAPDRTKKFDAEAEEGVRGCRAATPKSITRMFSLASRQMFSRERSRWAM